MRRFRSLLHTSQKAPVEPPPRGVQNGRPPSLPALNGTASSISKDDAAVSNPDGNEQYYVDNPAKQNAPGKPYDTTAADRAQ